MEFPKADVGGQNRGQSPRELWEGLPDTERGGNQWRGLFWVREARFPFPARRTVCLFRSRAYLWVMTVHFPFQNTYSALPADFFARVAPTPVAAPRLIKLNRPLAVQLGLDPDVL